MAGLPREKQAYFREIAIGVFPVPTGRCVGQHTGDDGGRLPTREFLLEGDILPVNVRAPDVYSSATRR
jgi:hypothetical protein